MLWYIATARSWRTGSASALPDPAEHLINSDGALRSPVLFSRRLSSGALRRRERLGFLAFFQHAGDGCNRSACFNGGGTGDARNQRLSEFLRVAQIRVGLDEWLLFHVQIIAERP